MHVMTTHCLWACCHSQRKLYWGDTLSFQLGASLVICHHRRWTSRMLWNYRGWLFFKIAFKCLLFFLPQKHLYVFQYGFSLSAVSRSLEAAPWLNLVYKFMIGQDFIWKVSSVPLLCIVCLPFPFSHCQLWAVGMLHKGVLSLKWWLLWCSTFR